MPCAPRLLTRRTTLALAGAGLVALTACDHPDEAVPPKTEPTTDPDQTLVDGVIEKQRDAWQGAVLASAFDTAAMHEAHLQALGGSTPTPAAGRMPIHRLHKVERRLRRDLVDAAMDARSGELARLLASMSAAVAQRLGSGLT